MILVQRAGSSSIGLSSKQEGPPGCRPKIGPKPNQPQFVTNFSYTDDKPTCCSQLVGHILFQKLSLASVAQVIASSLLFWTPFSLRSEAQDGGGQFAASLLLNTWVRGPKRFRVKEGNKKRRLPLRVYFLTCKLRTLSNPRLRSPGRDIEVQAKCFGAFRPFLSKHVPVKGEPSCPGNTHCGRL